MSEAEAQSIGRHLGAVDTNLRRPAAGLAVFHDRSGLYAFGLSGEPAQSVTVAENFALRPLLAAIRHNQPYSVLVLSTHRIALFRGDAFGLAAVEAQGVPAALEQALASERPGKEVFPRAPRADAPWFGCHDGGWGERRLDVERFDQRIARAIQAGLEGHDEPVVLVAAPAHHAWLRASLRLPRLLAEGVETTPDHLSPGELHARSWPLVERAVAAEEASTAGGFEGSAQRGKGLHRIDDVALAAASGRIHRLWIKPDERMPGAIDPTSGALVAGRAREDIFDGLVTLVLRHGGEVMVADRIPSGTSLAAELH